MKTKRKEVPVRNNPGIYKELRFEEASQKWKETGKFRAIRRAKEESGSKKEQAVFDNIEDAKSFRMGHLEKGSNGPQVHKLNSKDPSLTFGNLVQEWKSFHYLGIDPGTRQTYDKRLRHLDFLNRYAVERIDATVIDDLVKSWVNGIKDQHRKKFDMELKILRVILNFFRQRKKPDYVIPILDGHYSASDITKAPDKPVDALSQEELGSFFEQLRASKNPQYYHLALVQFSLGLRIGETCGLSWNALDLENRTARIETTVIWDQVTWKPSLAAPKSGKVRVLVLPELVAQELERLKLNRTQGVELVFHKNGQPLNRKTIGCAYNRALQRAGITHTTGTHILRKTSATQANEITGDFDAVSKQLGHSSASITRRYVKHTDLQKQRVANALNGVLGVAMQGTQVPAEKLDLESRHTAPVPQCPAPGERPKLTLIKSAS